jgi:hypothetical protein
MGATIQMTRYSVDSKLILLDDSEVPAETQIKVISGHNILSNNQVRMTFFFFSHVGSKPISWQVNLISSMVTAAVLGFLGSISVT